MALIVLLEDDPEFAALLTEFLRKAGHDVDWFHKAEDALTHVQENPCDIVVADLIIKEQGRSVPEGGAFLTFRIKTWAREHDRTLPIIAISGAVHHVGMQGALGAAAQLGADAIVPKPCPPQYLLALINKLLMIDGDEAEVGNA